jgi:hypothetical protein
MSFRLPHSAELSNSSRGKEGLRRHFQRTKTSALCIFIHCSLRFFFFYTGFPPITVANKNVMVPYTAAPVSGGDSCGYRKKK